VPFTVPTDAFEPRSKDLSCVRESPREIGVSALGDPFAGVSHGEDIVGGSGSKENIDAITNSPPFQYGRCQGTTGEARHRAISVFIRLKISIYGSVCNRLTILILSVRWDQDWCRKLFVPRVIDG
jgi:hypothetical protein